MSRSVKVSVAGQTIALRTDAKPKYVKELAAYVTAKMQEVKSGGRTATTQSLALLAAMQIADELHQLQRQQAQLKRSVKEKTERILRYLESEADS